MVLILCCNSELCYPTAGESEEKVESDENPVPSEKGKLQESFLLVTSEANALNEL